MGEFVMQKPLTPMLEQSKCYTLCTYKHASVERIAPSIVETYYKHASVERIATSVV